MKSVLFVLFVHTSPGLQLIGNNGIVKDEQAEMVTQAEFLTKNDKEFEAVFKGIIEKQTDIEHYIGNLTEHFSSKGARHEIDWKLLSEG